MTDSTSDELRQRGIDFLLSQKNTDKKPYEFPVRELAVILKIAENSVYSHMAVLVRNGVWGTRKAYDPEVHKVIQVYWLIEDKPEETP